MKLYRMLLLPTCLLLVCAVVSTDQLIPSWSVFPFAITQVGQPDYTLYLPLADHTASQTTSLFGVSLGRSNVNDTTIAHVATTGVSWVRYDAILWSEVEASPGVRDWSRLSQVEAELRTLAAAGVTVTVSVSSVPGWAQQVPGVACGPIAPAALEAFASFVGELVARYSVPPYNVRYWEIWNEPDIDPALVAGDSPFGCWGDAADPYYGGGAYATMLQRVYPAIKQANPAAQVLLGGLLLDCDPTHETAAACPSGQFLEGVLRNGGGAAFDILAYHSYAYWSPVTHDWDQLHTAWEHRGGVFVGKLDFVRTIMRQYGVTKPVMLNEGCLICLPSNTVCPGGTFLADQANYAIRLYTRAWASNVQAVIWYNLSREGWRQGGLLDSAGQPRPVYQALTFMTTLLRGATFAAPVTTGTLEGYTFFRGRSSYTVYWTNDGSSVKVTLPTATQAVYDYQGRLIPITDAAITVGFSPIFIVAQH